MNFLLDTHVLLWALKNDLSLNSTARSIIEDTSNHIYVSSISIVEIQIKSNIGKLSNIPDNLENIIQEVPFNILPFDHRHAFAIKHFKFVHKDPFDWMLIAQAIVEDSILVTHDKDIMKYDIQILET
jgi:PIN domain nuclease of toxin-antitoxin system